MPLTGGSGFRVRNTSSTGYSELIFDNDTTPTAFGAFVFGYGGTSAAAGSNVAYFWQRRNAPMLFGTNDTERMRIFGGGNVAINSTSDTGERLQVSGSSRFNGNVIITGSLTVTQGITGSLFGTASWAQNAVTASYALNSGVTQIIAGTNVTISPAGGTGSVTINATGGGGASFPFTGSALITGSLVITGSTTSTLGFTGSLFGTASWAQNAVTASYALTAQTLLGSVVSASYAATSSYATNFYVSGTLNVGNTNIEFQENTNVTSGSWRVISSEPTASYRAAFFDYVMFSGSIARAGTIYSVWSASYAEYYENYTGDVGGSTAGVTLQAAISGSNIQLQATASNNAWTIRSLVRML